MQCESRCVKEDISAAVSGRIMKMWDQSPEKSDLIRFLKENVIFAGYILPNIVNYGFDTDFFECFYAKNDQGNNISRQQGIIIPRKCFVRQTILSWRGILQIESCAKIEFFNVMITDSRRKFC